MRKNFVNHLLAVPLGAVMLLALITTPGCAADDSDRAADLRQQAAALFPRIDPAASAPTAADCAGSWAVLLQVFTPEQADQAQATLAFARDQARLDDARLEQRSLGLTLLAGRFPSASDPRAASALSRVRAFEIEGRRPFAGAILLPPGSSGSLGGAPQWSLTRLRQSQGEDAALYTLQVAVYEAGDPSLACRTAEQAVATLRADGEEAFYHHGSGRSIVAVGVFTPSDYDPLTGATSQRLEQLRRRFPYNLVNGRTIRERLPDGNWVEQPSALVVVP